MVGGFCLPVPRPTGGAWDDFQNARLDKEIAALAPDLPLRQERYEFLLQRKADLVNERLALLDELNTWRARIARTAQQCFLTTMTWLPT